MAGESLSEVTLNRSQTQARAEWGHASTSALRHALRALTPIKHQKWATSPWLPSAPWTLLLLIRGQPSLAASLAVWHFIHKRPLLEFCGGGRWITFSSRCEEPPPPPLLLTASIHGVRVRRLAYLEQGWRELQDAFPNDQRAAGRGYHHRILLQAAHDHAPDVHGAQLDVFRVHKVSARRQLGVSPHLTVSLASTRPDGSGGMLWRCLRRYNSPKLAPKELSKYHDGSLC